MSEMERKIGTLNLIDEDHEEYAKAFCKEHGIPEESWFDSALDALLDDYPSHHMLIGEKLYAIEVESVDDDHISITKHDDGSISFDCSYYNGSCCLTEAIEDGLKSYEEKLNK